MQLAVPRDAVDIAAMSRELIEHGLPWSWRAPRVRQAIEATNTNVAVVRAHDGLAAFGIMAYGDDDAHLLLFAVQPSCQRRGLGSSVLRWLEAAAVAAGCRCIRVEARRGNHAARCFYNQHGYHERAIASRMYSAAVDGIRLEKWLLGPDAGGDGNNLQPAPR